MAPRRDGCGGAAARRSRVVAGIGGKDSQRAGGGVGHEHLVVGRVQGDRVRSGPSRDGPRRGVVSAIALAVHGDRVAAFVGDVERAGGGVDRLRHGVAPRGRRGHAVDVAALGPLVPGRHEDGLAFGRCGLQQRVFQVLHAGTDIGLAAIRPADADDLCRVVAHDCLEDAVDVVRRAALVHLDVRLRSEGKRRFDVQLGLHGAASGDTRAGTHVPLCDLTPIWCDAVAVREAFDVAPAVAGCVHLDQGDRRACAVTVPAVQTPERVRLRQLGGVERAAALPVGDGRATRGAGRGLPRCERGRHRRDTGLRDSGRSLWCAYLWLRRCQCVEPEDALYLRSDRDRDFRRGVVVVPRLARRELVLRDRRRKGGLRLSDCARHGERQTKSGRRPDGQAFVLERGGDRRDGRGGGTELLGELCRREETAVVRRARVRHRLRIRRQGSGVPGLQPDGEWQRVGRRSWSDGRRPGRYRCLVAGQRTHRGDDGSCRRRRAEGEAHGRGDSEGRAQESKRVKAPATHVFCSLQALVTHRTDPCVQANSPCIPFRAGVACSHVWDKLSAARVTRCSPWSIAVAPRGLRTSGFCHGAVV